MTNDYRIVYEDSTGVLCVIIPTLLCKEEDLLKLIPPEVVDYDIISLDDFPEDRIFRKAWARVDGFIQENLGKAIEIAHDIRRAKRSSEFEPLDMAYVLDIPGNNKMEIEKKRQVVRDKYDIIQINIDKCISVSELRLVLKSF